MGNILGMVWLLFSTSKGSDVNEAETTGHEWDGIKEPEHPIATLVVVVVCLDHRLRGRLPSTSILV